MFIVKDSGHEYKVWVRSAYKNSIRSEKALRQALYSAMFRVYGAQAANDTPLWKQDESIGIVGKRIMVK